MYLLHKKFKLTLKKIGALFSNKAHSGVIAGIKRIQKKIKSSSEVQQQIQDIEKLL
jgi:chromosomal replication initiation ATPase DnaA